MQGQTTTEIIDNICDAFEAEWLAGRVPEIEQWLAKVEPELRAKLLPELVRVDLEYRLRDGVTDLSLSEYLQNFGLDPEHISLHRIVPTDRPDANASTVTPNGNQSARLRAKQTSPGIPQRIAAYDILGKVGEGGMGVVYRARHRTLGRIVALKTIPNVKSHNPDVRTRFRTEVEAVAQLDHPGIVPVFDVGEQDGVPWFAMAFVEGATLRAQIQKQPIPGRQAAATVLQITQALQYAHQKGIIHRDIKPSNVLMEADGTARLTDFGLAKLSSREETLTASGEVLGTAAYMPPEQAAGESVAADVRSDVYSMGALLYCCITGRPPFQAANIVEILRQVIEEVPVSPRRLNAEIDVDLQVICLKCLEKNPLKRFPTAEALVAELRRYLSREPILSRPVSRVSRFARWCCRRPFAAASGLLAILLLLVLLVTIPTVITERSDRERAELLATTNASLAATQKYYATVHNVREQRLLKEPGWTWSALAALQQAAALPANGKDPTELRSLMTSTLMSPDVRPVAGFAADVDTSDVAASRDGRYVALCETRGRDAVSVFVYEIDSTQRSSPTVSPFREFRMPLVEHPSGKPDGFRSVCFSNDGTTIAAGTRHGDILEWSLKKPTSRNNTAFVTSLQRDDRQPIRHFTTDDYTVYQLRYSADDSRLISASEQPAEIRVWDRQSETCLHTFPSVTASFAVVDPEELIFSQGACVAMATARAADSLREISWSQIGNNIADVNASADGTIIAATHGEPRFFSTWLRDADEGNRTIELLSRDMELSLGGITKVHAQERYFSRGNSIVLASVTPRRLRIWDALSGTIACDYLVSDRETPPITYINASELISVSGHNGSQLLELRRPRTLQTDGETTGTRDAASECVQTFAPSAWRISDFDLNAAGTQVTILEGMKVDSGQRRVRTFDIQTGHETARWTTRNLQGTDFHLATPIQGIRVTQHGIHATLAGPGFPFLLTDNGFEPIPGLTMPVVQTLPKSNPDSRIDWEFPEEFPRAKNLPNMQVCVALKFPRPFPRNGESLNFEVTGGSEIRKSQLDSTDFRPIFDGWNLLRVDYRTIAHQRSRGLSVRLGLTSDEMGVTTDPKIAQGTDLLIGPAFLIATPALDSKVHNHGVASVQGDGTTFYVDDDLRLLKWSGEQLQPRLAWEDADDSWVHIRDVDSGQNSTAFGTRKGDVYLANATDRLRTLHRAPRSKSGGDTADDIQCVAMTGDDSVAIAGTLNGELLLFDLSHKEQPLMGREQIHRNGVSTMAITDDSRLIATANTVNRLRLWQRHQGTVNLLLDLDQSHNQVIRLQFSPNGDRLFILCANERGLRILNLRKLREVFALANIDWEE